MPGLQSELPNRQKGSTMKKNLFVLLLFVVLLLILVGCNSTRFASDQDDVPAAQMTIEVPAAAETPAEELPPTTVVALIVIVVVLALSNERLIEALKKLGWIQPNQAPAWQSVFGGLAIAALALAKYLGLEGQITAPVNNLVEVATGFSLFILAFGQAGLAKLFHEIWKQIGWVAKPVPKQLPAVAVAIDRG